MDIPSELKQQAELRMALLDDMMASGAINTPVGCLETPMLLVMHMPDEALTSLHKKLKRTRKRLHTFHLNGRTYCQTRRDAIALVVMEANMRSSAVERPAQQID